MSLYRQTRRILRRVVASDQKLDFLVAKQQQLCIRHFAGYSSTWQTVDQRQGEGSSQGENTNQVPAPDPLGYLQGFDAVPEIAAYKGALQTACNLQPSQSMLDVGCGTGTELTKYANQVGPSGKIVAIDYSKEMIQQVSSNQQLPDNVSLQVANAYSLPFASNSFDVVKEDRVLQHLVRPLEAVQELLRVVKPGGLLVVANPDFRSFQIDAPSQRWGDSTRPPDDLNFDLSVLTTKVLNGVIPTLAQHSAIGLQSPRLLHKGGCRNVELQVVPIPLIGRENLEAIVPITYMAQLSRDNGHISEHEMNQWLDRLEWEGNDVLFGILNMYICRGIKPCENENDLDSLPPPIGSKLFSDRSPPRPKHDVQIRMANSQTDSADLIEQARALINNEYGMSDTGITLSSTRLRPQDINEMVRQGQLFLAEDEETGELLGCIQVLIKKTAGPKTIGGLPTDDRAQKTIAEFTCLAVSSDHQTQISNANTQQVIVERMQSSSRVNRRGRGIGPALVRAAEAYAREQGAEKMQLAIMCPAQGPEPDYKQWLQKYYLLLGYEHKTDLYLDFEKDEQGNVVVDQLHAMYEPLHQLVQCKAIMFDKSL